MDIQTAWNRLLLVKRLNFESRSTAAETTGWSGTGSGVVEVEAARDSTILFYESGTWTPDRGRPTAFTNSYRWTADPEGGFIGLEHLRFGPERPVYLFDLVPVAEHILQSAEPHICRDDLYTARMEFGDQTIRLNWQVTGPKKAETISYVYQ